MTIKTIRNEDGMKVAALLVDGKNAIELSGFQERLIKASLRKRDQEKLNSVLAEITREYNFIANREREEFYKKKLEELSICSADQLKGIAKESGIRLFTAKPEKMLAVIAHTLTSRAFHGSCFANMGKGKNEISP